MIPCLRKECAPTAIEIIGLSSIFCRLTYDLQYGAVIPTCSWAAGLRTGSAHWSADRPAYRAASRVASWSAAGMAAGVAVGMTHRMTHRQAGSRCSRGSWVAACMTSGVTVCVAAWRGIMPRCVICCICRRVGLGFRIWWVNVVYSKDDLSVAQERSAGCCRSWPSKGACQSFNWVSTSEPSIGAAMLMKHCSWGSSR